MWWLALTTETYVSLSDESTSIASSTRQPLLHSILSVAFSVIYSERKLDRSPLLSDIARERGQAVCVTTHKGSWVKRCM